MLPKLKTALSELFNTEPSIVDPNYYLRNYPDVAASGMDPNHHFMQFGWREGRNPSASFHTLFYKDKYMRDIKFENPAKHYMKSTLRRSVTTTPASARDFVEIQRPMVEPYFDEDFYRSTYQIRLDVDALEHYLTIGWREGFDPSPTFSASEYLKFNSHVATTGVSPLYHCVSTQSKPLSRAARRSTQPLRSLDAANIQTESNLPDREKLLSVIAQEFDAAHYLRENSDVAAANVDPLDHYVDHGWREGRNPSPLFWTNYYLSQYGDVRSAGINPFYHYIVFGRSEGRSPNPIGRTLWSRPEAPSDDDWLEARPASRTPGATVTVIMPVYKGYADTLAAIYSILANPQKTKFNLLVLNDCSPDAALTSALRRLHEKGLFDYFENEENRGFVATVNIGIAREPLLDVVLQNSDTVVYGDWLDRILAHADHDPSIASITPMSNNATICSYPDTNRNNLISVESSPSVIDEFARVCNRGIHTSIPTGVGFCMYMRRSVIDNVGALDEASFGRGYGEENDWCVRAIKAGFKNVLAHDVFVFHTGQISFADFAADEYGAGQTALSRKHPDYKLRVQQYISADPGRWARMRLDLYRLARRIGRNSAVFVTHVWGGGIETHVQDLAKRLAEENLDVVYLRVGVGGDGARIELASDQHIYAPSIEQISLSREGELIGDFLSWLEPRMAHVHSFAGLSWNATKNLMSIIRETTPVYYFTSHDFSSICHRHHLVTNEGLYCGQPSVDICAVCAKTDSEHSEYVDPLERRAVYDTFLSGAQSVFTPSSDTRMRLSRAYPSIDCRVRPHEETFPTAEVMTTTEETDGPLQIAIIGAIGPHKGAAIVHALALDAKQRALPIHYSIVGYSCYTPLLAELGVMETGRYRDVEEAFELLRQISPHLALFPSIWPETHCYTLSIALAAGISPVVFDIGAPAERLRALGLGGVLDFALADDPCALNDALLSLRRADLGLGGKKVTFQSYRSLLDDYYASNSSGAYGACATDARESVSDPTASSKIEVG
ncbi:MAG: glycosyl transferase [Methylocystaceae bacterium]|nr:MAG: glycosyl transferase [Methylocystaceae bacterium]